MLLCDFTGKLSLSNDKKTKGLKKFFQSIFIADDNNVPFFNYCKNENMNVLFLNLHEVCAAIYAFKNSNTLW